MEAVLNNLLAETREETRYNTMIYVDDMKYKVTDMYKLAKKTNFDLMCEIHANGKEGDYKKANMLSVVYHTLETYVKPEIINEVVA